MLAQERQQKLLDILYREKKIIVLDVVSRLNSSPATIRRDLAELERKKNLVRVHGGAILPPNHQEDALEEKLHVRKIEKQKIAERVATQFLTHAHTIYLDAGSTTHCIIPFLNAQQHHVVTNGVHHIPLLMERGIATVLIGGRLKTKTQAIVGATAIKQLENYAFDLAIIGANSVHATFGFSTPDEEEALLKTQALFQATQKVVVADSSKFNTRSLHQFAPFQKEWLVSDQVYRKESIR